METKVSDIGFEKLQNALPQLVISRGLDLEKLATEAPKPPTPAKTESSDEVVALWRLGVSAHQVGPRFSHSGHLPQQSKESGQTGLD